MQAADRGCRTMNGVEVDRIVVEPCLEVVYRPTVYITSYVPPISRLYIREERERERERERSAKDKRQEIQRDLAVFALCSSLLCHG